MAAATLGCHQFNPDFARGEDGADERGAGTETPTETESGEQGESSSTDSSGAEATTSTGESSSSSSMGEESSGESEEEGSTSTEEGSSEEGPVDTSEGPFDTGEETPLDEGFDVDTGNTFCIPLVPDECQECAAAECCEYYELCSQPTKCSCFVQCVGEGGTVVACMADCGQPELGDTEAGALALCVLQACSTPCSL